MNDRRAAEAFAQLLAMAFAETMSEMEPLTREMYRAALLHHVDLYLGKIVERHNLTLSEQTRLSAFVQHHRQCLISSEVETFWLDRDSGA